ncbi:hypothetical protein [uncultured Arthrobacter sp.]|uniref:hypothetical protein n=1 Tax=uncultured Arthrobacter sp. TaxID=114050 RepID=UPI00321722EF
MDRICRHCGRAFTAKRVDAEYCGTACRVTVHRQRRDAQRRAALDLLARQSEALASGADEAVLAELAREARRLLGD